MELFEKDKPHPAYIDGKLVLEIGSVYEYKNTMSVNAYFGIKDNEDARCIIKTGDTLLLIDMVPREGENMATLYFVYDDKVVSYTTKTNREFEFYDNYFMKIA